MGERFWRAVLEDVPTDDRAETDRSVGVAEQRADAAVRVDDRHRLDETGAQTIELSRRETPEGREGRCRGVQRRGNERRPVSHDGDGLLVMVPSS